MKLVTVVSYEHIWRKGGSYDYITVDFFGSDTGADGIPAGQQFRSLKYYETDFSYGNRRYVLRYSASYRYFDRYMHCLL